MTVALLAAGIVTLALFILATLRAVSRLTARVDDLTATVRTLEAARAAADGELDRVQHLLDRADVISTRVESTSKLAYRTFAAPVIKALAVGKGTSQAARSLRHRTGRP